MFGFGVKLNDEKDEHEEGKDDSKSNFSWEQTNSADRFSFNFSYSSPSNDNNNNNSTTNSNFGFGSPLTSTGGNFDFNFSSDSKSNTKSSNSGWKFNSNNKNQSNFGANDDAWTGFRFGNHDLGGFSFSSNNNSNSFAFSFGSNNHTEKKEEKKDDEKATPAKEKEKEKANDATFGTTNNKLQLNKKTDGDEPERDVPADPGVIVPKVTVFTVGGSNTNDEPYFPKDLNDYRLKRLIIFVNSKGKDIAKVK